MFIRKVKIKNFKCFKEEFIIELSDGLNIIVGDNEAGKSTILEAIHLVLSGLYNGKYLKNEISEYLFNNLAIEEYKKSLSTSAPLLPPEITIEVFIDGDEMPLFIGDGNSERIKLCGLGLKISLDDRYKAEYEDYIKHEVIGLPIEYYDFAWTSFAREPVTPRRIQLRSVLIDSSCSRYQNGSDVYISHIIRNHLNEQQKNSLIQAHRKLQSSFVNEDAVKQVNEVIKGLSQSEEGDKKVKLAVDLSSKNAWENSFLTYVEDIPFHHIGKGEQVLVKTKIALQHKKAKEANLILLEEPENHLSHSKLNELVRDIEEKCSNKQIIISTHSSFVANKLGLENLVILNKRKQIRLNVLEQSTQNFFRKIPGYDTLRLILCKKAILVEGDSDELVVQKAYLNKNGVLPIQNGIDVISVGTSFLRFLEIAELLKKPVVVVTDNDGDIESLNTKYSKYIGENKKDYIKICYDTNVDSGNLIIGGKPFNYNTLEPKLLKANSVELLNKVLEREDTEEELLKYMKSNKTDCALKFFDYQKIISFPQYIMQAVE